MFSIESHPNRAAAGSALWAPPFHCEHPWRGLSGQYMPAKGIKPWFGSVSGARLDESDGGPLVRRTDKHVFRASKGQARGTHGEVDQTAERERSLN